MGLRRYSSATGRCHLPVNIVRVRTDFWRLRPRAYGLSGMIVGLMFVCLRDIPQVSVCCLCCLFFRMVFGVVLSAPHAVTIRFVSFLGL